MQTGEKGVEKGVDASFACVTQALTKLLNGSFEPLILVDFSTGLGHMLLLDSPLSSYTRHESERLDTMKTVKNVNKYLFHQAGLFQI